MASKPDSIALRRQPNESNPMKGTIAMHRCRIPLAGVFLMLATVVVSAQTPSVREVSASERSLIPITTKLRYTTMILLPDGEEILDVVCGDRDFWVIAANQNTAHVKPAKEGAATNLNLVTASGRVFSFLLTEDKATAPDLKVYVTADPSAAPSPRKYFSAADIIAIQEQLSVARATADAARRGADEAIAAFKQQYPVSLQFTYGTLKYEKPFFVRAIWHDGQFTYIRSDARELPALYEIKDGHSSLLNFQVQHSTYVIPKVLDWGYLVLGRKHLQFQQER
jgi:type IV secretory pathway VirB9-like protein